MSSLHRQPLLPHFTPDNKNFKRNTPSSPNLDRLLLRAPPQGNFNVNYDTYTLRIPNYVFSTPSLLPGSGGLMAVALGKRTTDDSPVLAKLSPYAIRLEREFYMTRRIRLQDGQKYIPKVIELVSLPNDGLTALIYADIRADDLVLLEKHNSFRFRPLLDLSLVDGQANDGRQAQTEGPCDLHSFLNFAIECCSCVHFLHSNAIIHGELRPSAFQWRPKEGTVKIWNFGAGLKSYEEILLKGSGWRQAIAISATAAQHDEQQEAWDQTNHSHSHYARLYSSKGFQSSLAYVSPEQAGRTSNVLDHRTDLYSLGILFYAVLIGQMPFEGTAIDIVHAALSRNVPLVHTVREDLPAALGLIIDKLTRKSVDERYSSAYGLREDLIECQRRLHAASGPPQLLAFFPLGLNDINSVFQFPSAIFGRDEEIELIRTVTRRVSSAHEQEFGKSQLRLTSSASSAGSEEASQLIRMESPSLDKACCEVIVVMGPGGIGKSTLASVIHSHARQHGYLATAKFDSNQKRPYNGLLRCLSSILRQLLTESESVIHNFYSDLKKRLGPQFNNVRLMVDMVPELKPILGDHEEEVIEPDSDKLMTHLVNTESRFHAVFLSVVRTIAHKKMITLCLDDIQEADEPSLHLITNLITSRITMLIVLTSRDGGEMPETVSSVIEDPDEMTDAQATFINLAPLGVGAISQLVSETLHRTADDVQPLVDIIFHRTRGNPFYAKQFMLMMNRKEDIWLDWTEKRWKFRLDNASQLLCSLKPPENTNTFIGSSHELDVLDVRHLVSHLQDLDPLAQAFLKWASLIGSTFDFRQIKWLMMAVAIPEADDYDTNDPCTDQAHSAGSRDSAQDALVDIVVMDPESNEGQMSVLEEKKRANQTMTGLQVALQEGIIQPRMGSEFQFVHDRYCQAASMLVQDDARARMNLKIGEMLMLDNGADVFLTADHLVKSILLVQSLQHRSKYRATLIKAGDGASSSGALSLAWKYYDCAISTLAANPWEDGEDAEYQETLDLYLKMSELNWWNNRRMEAKEQLNQVMQRTAVRPVERARAWQIQARMYFQQHQYEKGVDTIMEALEGLGMEGMSRSLVILDSELVRLYEELKSKIKQVGVEALESQVGPCVDRRILAIMSLLYEASTGAYWSNPQLVEYIALKLVQLSLEHGYGPASGGGFIWLGCTSVSRFSEYQLGVQLGELGLAINEKHAGNSEIARAIIMHHMVLARWTGCHCRDYIYQYQRAHRYAIAGGDKVFSAIALFHMSCSLFWTGSNLSNILGQIINHNMEECEEDDTKDVMTLNISLWRCILAFQGKTSTDTSRVFDSAETEEEDGFDEQVFIQDVQKDSTNPASQLNWHWSFKLVVLVHFGYYLEAAHLGFDIAETSTNHTGHWHIGIANFYHSLAMITCLRSEPHLNAETRQKFFHQVQTHYRKLREWADHSRINYGMYYKLVEAEISTLENNLERTTRLYNAAIEEALRGEWTSCLGLTYERAAEFYIRANVSMLAMPMLHRAIEYYNQWGASGKSNFLAKRHSALLGTSLGTHNDMVDASVQTEDDFGLHTELPALKEGIDTHWDDDSPEHSLRDIYGDEQLNALATPESALFSLDIVDLTSIIKSSQVISNEVNSFDELLKKMMGIIMTNSGAETGAIILKEGGFGLTAHSTRSGGYETFDPPMQLGDENVPISALVAHYVIHTHTMLFIPNIQEDTRFATGPWFTRVGAKSVMCLPILHKGTLVGVLYLQANVNAFTLKHVTVLSLLCDQIGISLTNALLFKSVRRATATNAEMIESQKQALEEARTSREQALKATKLKSNFLANMSHELRTPFSGFYGMISLLSETRLDPEQREFVLIAKQSCEMLLHIIDDLLDFSKLEARKVKLHSGLLYIEDLIADRMELLITLASKKHLEMTYFIDPDVPTMVYGDGNRIGQILMNLIGNAIKFTHHGEVVVRCALEKGTSTLETPLLEDEVVLKFSVQDTGIGMTPEEIKCLFLPFSQVDGSTTRNFGGTGLGLSICLELVRLMGGTIWVESVEGKGSTFFFQIRIMKACSMNEPGVDADPRESQMKELKEHIGSPRILLAASCRQTALFESLAPSFDYSYVTTAEEGPHFAEKQVQLGKPPFDYIVVNSPTPQTMRQLVESIETNPSLSRLRILLLYAPTVDNIRRHIASSGNEPSMQHYIFHHRVVRISKPLRRLKLLSALEKAGQAEAPVVPLASPLRPLEMATRAVAVAEKPPLDLPPLPTVIESSFSSTCLQETRGIFTPEELAIFQGKRILIAEDNAVAQKLIEKQLTRLGFVVETCNNGKECIQSWVARPPYYFMLAWIDHHMPECDGLEATRQIRQLEREKKLTRPMPIIALTADIQKVTQKNCIEAGMNDYVTKPLMQKDLENILRRYCLKSETNTI